MQSDQLKHYLERIGMEKPEKPDLDALKQIQEKHIYAIPVENLDIINGNLPLSLAIDDLFDKVVNRRRGGLSFELNLLLADALRGFGYGVKLMSARHPKYGHEFDHAFLLVTVPGDDCQWVVDVGYTENFRTPLMLDSRIWQSDGRDEYSFAKIPGDKPEGDDGQGVADELCAWQLLRRRAGVVEQVYSFTLKEREPKEYVEQCEWFCTNDQSRFTQGPFVFIERPEGRICLSMDMVINTFTGEQIRPVVKNDDEEHAILREIFGIEVDEGPTDDAAHGKFSHKRVFAAVAEDELFDEVVERATAIALERKAHLRFGHIVNESSHDRQESFPAYVQEVRERLSGRIVGKLDSMSVTDELFGGEVVVMGSNSRIGATIDTPVDYAPEQLVESMIKPFRADVVVCGSSKGSRLQSFFRGSTSGYLARKLDCEILTVGKLQ